MRSRAGLLAVAVVFCIGVTPGIPAVAAVKADASTSRASTLQPYAPEVSRLKAPPGVRVASGDPSSFALVTPAADTAVFGNGFETWPGAWTAGAASGPTWGQTSYNSSEGNYSAYCAGSSIAAPGPYANNMDGWMMAGPFNLSTYDAATLTFDMWLDAESGFDGLVAGASTDGSSFEVEGWTGDSDGWELGMTLDLADIHGDASVDFTGESQVWIAFIFQSDISNTDEGAYVDNVHVTASATPPNTPPVATANSYETDEDEALTVAAPGVLGNDTDADAGATLTASKASGPSHGLLSLSSNGGFTYTPADGFYGTDSFTYRAYDGEDYSNTVAVTITVDEAAAPLPPVIEVAGATRYVTAVEASKLAYPKGASTVVIATGRNWPDALGGSALAGTLDAPILLTDPGSLNPAALAEIDRLGATRAVILGGTGAVSTAVENALKAKLGAGNVERIAGSDRYATANKVAQRVITELGGEYDGTAFVATGGNFPDALAAAPLAAAKKWPLYLAHPTAGVSGATLAAMAGVTKVIVLGGTGAISSQVEDNLRQSFSVSRLAGSTRYSTACMVAEYGVSNAGLVWNRVGIATGQNYPDALAGGVLQGKVGSVMLLTRTSSLCTEAGLELLSKRASITNVTFLGGTGAVSQATRNSVLDALAGTWSPPAPPPPPGGVTPVDGVWHGLMANSTYEAVTMNIRNGKITTEGSTLPQGCSMVVRYPYSNVTVVTYVYDDIPIVNGSFEHSWGSASSMGGAKHVEGTFSSATSVTGSASHNEHSTFVTANMSYNWAASK